MFRITTASLLVAFVWAASAVAAPPGQSLGRTRSTTERILPERLAAASADAARYQAARRELALNGELVDFRAAIHVHASDSDHTGGTLDELLAEAKRADVDIVMLSDHYRPPRDFMDGWRGLREGVLFIPGSEGKGFLLYPEAPVMDKMDGDKASLIAAVGAGSGMLFLSHVEKRLDHDMAGLTGAEIYNRHYDAEDDMDVVLALTMALTDPVEYEKTREALEMYHEAFLACQIDYPSLYLGKWDRETVTRRLTGVGAIDCHHNNKLVLKMKDARTALFGTNVDPDEDLREIPVTMRPGIAALLEGHEPGDIVAAFDLDTYYHSFRTMSTHILAEELTETAVRHALREGRAYVSFDWMCDPTGFAYYASGGGDRVAPMGGEAPLAALTALEAHFPVACKTRVIRNGQTVHNEATDTLRYEPSAPGTYRVEAWLDMDGEERLWILSNPIYVR